QSQTVNASTPATFFVIAAGAPTLSYQWRKDGVSLPGATATSLTISNVQPTDAGNYDVLVTNGAGSVTSTPATLTVNSLPAIATPPRSETLFVGMKVNFTVSATGAQPLAYQWQHEGVNMPGANNTGLALVNVSLSAAGNYAVVVTNTYGSVTSSPA